MTRKPERNIAKMGKQHAATITEENGLLLQAIEGEKLFGSTDSRFMPQLASQLVNAVSIGQEISKEESEFAFAVIENMNPQDETEGMLIAQMAANHSQTMRFHRKLAHSRTLQEIEVMEKALSKLSRTFTTQMETLRKYRTNGEQKVTVQHVQVNEGGQAIVGNVSHNSGKGGGVK